MKTLRAALLGAVFSIGGAVAANAADIYSKGSLKDAPPPVAYLPPITWAGFYFGGHLGAAFNNDDSFFFDNLNYPGKRFDGGGNDDTTWLAGIQLGYNWQTPSNWVWGIEGDVSFADNIDYLATIRGRLGYAYGDSLWYVTGGAAFIGFSDDFHNSFAPDFVFHDSDSDTGWVLGLGAEYKLRPNWSIGLEGLYYNFGNGNDHFFDADRLVGFHRDDENFWVVRARLNYFFNTPYEEPLK